MSMPMKSRTRSDATTLSAPLGAQRTSQRINLKTDSEAKAPSDFANMLIQKDGEVDIRLGDVADIEIGTTELNNLDRYNQDQVVLLGFIPSPAPVKSWWVTHCTKPSRDQRGPSGRSRAVHSL